MFYNAKAYTIAKRNSPTALTPAVPLRIHGRLAACVRICRAIAMVAMTLLPASVSALSVRLPADEDGLAELLSTQVLDTIQYEQLLAFYALPLSVPHGELVYLTPAFPDIAEMIPASLEELAAYQPFDNRQIRRLFNDYPALADFEPILRFNDAMSSAESSGEVVVGINRSSIKALRGHGLRFRRKGAMLSAEGAAAFGDSAARWRSRRLDLSYRGVNAHIGNFRRPMPVELTTGRFAPLSSLTELSDGKMSASAAGWLYGGDGAWNGVSVNAGEIWGEAVGASAFCHLRPAEAGGGAGANVKIGKRATAFAGLTGFWLGAADDGGARDGDYADDDADYADDDVDYAAANSGGDVAAKAYYYAHLFAEYKGKGVLATAEAAVPLAEESVAPALSLRLNYRAKGSSAEYRAIFYPADDAFPMSRQKKLLLTEIGEKGGLPPPVQKHIVRTTIPLIGDAVKLMPELDFTESRGVKQIRGQAEARARVDRADVAIKHAAKIPAADDARALRATSVSVNYRTSYPAEVRAAFQRAYGGYKNAKNIYSLEVPTTVVPSMVVAPYIRGKYASAANEYWVGIKSEFHLYKKTWTRATLETPVNVKGEGNVYVKVSSSYLF